MKLLATFVIVIGCFTDAFSYREFQFRPYRFRRDEDTQLRQHSADLTNGTYYAAPNIKKNFSEARRHCYNNYYELATIESFAEDELLQEFIAKIGGGGLHFYTSGSNRRETRNFEWESKGTLLRDTYIHDSVIDYVAHTDDKLKNQCVTVYGREYKDQPWQWNVYPCSQEFNFICERVTQECRVPEPGSPPPSEPSENDLSVREDPADDYITTRRRPPRQVVITRGTTRPPRTTTTTTTRDPTATTHFYEFTTPRTLPPFHEHDRRRAECYIFSSCKASRDEARRRCAARYAGLAFISTVREDDVFQELLFRNRFHDEYFWIAAEKNVSHIWSPTSENVTIPINVTEDNAESFKTKVTFTGITIGLHKEVPSGSRYRWRLSHPSHRYRFVCVRHTPVCLTHYDGRTSSRRSRDIWKSHFHRVGRSLGNKQLNDSQTSDPEPRVQGSLGNPPKKRVIKAPDLSEKKLLRINGTKKCYVILLDSVAISEANNTCKKLGHQLLSLADPEEEIQVTSSIRKPLSFPDPLSIMIMMGVYKNSTMTQWKYELATHNDKETNLICQSDCTGKTLPESTPRPSPGGGGGGAHKGRKISKRLSSHMCAAHAKFVETNEIVKDQLKKPPSGSSVGTCDWFNWVPCEQPCKRFSVPSC